MRSPFCQGGTLMLVLVEVEDRVATVTLNRPESRNAISLRTASASSTRPSRSSTSRDDVGCVVLTGADPAFCAGMDLKSLATEQRSDPAGTPASGRSVTTRCCRPTRPDHRRHQRPDGDRRPRARHVLRLPHRLGTGQLRRHARTGRGDARGRHDHPPAPARRDRPGAAHELHRRLHRRRHGVRLGPGGRGGAARGSAPGAGPRARRNHRVHPVGVRARAAARLRRDAGAVRGRGPRRRERVVAGMDGGALRPDRAWPPSARRSWREGGTRARDPAARRREGLCGHGPAARSARRHHARDSGSRGWATTGSTWPRRCTTPCPSRCSARSTPAGSGSAPAWPSPSPAVRRCSPTRRGTSRS